MIPAWAYVVGAVVGAVGGAAVWLVSYLVQRRRWRRDPLAGDQKRAWLDAQADSSDVPILAADGLDDAILGVAHRHGDAFVVYDVAQVIDILVRRDGMTPEDARDFYDFNIEGAFLPGSPAWLDRVPARKRRWPQP